MSLASGGYDDVRQDDAWSWWQAGRLRYNLALAAAGWTAYGLNALFFLAFRHPIWLNWQGALSMTLFLGVAFLVVMGAANLCYLLGPAVETMLRPRDVDRFRRAAYAMGLWGSVALPFVFPLVNLAWLIGGGAPSR